MPRFTSFLSPQGVLAIVDFAAEPQAPWHNGFVQIVKWYSNNPKYTPIDVVTELENAQLFLTPGKRKTASLRIQQTVEDYVDAQHAHSSLSLDSMGQEQSNQFRREMSELLPPHAQQGLLTFDVVAEITWGNPLQV
jgi:hypothetical protein